MNTVPNNGFSPDANRRDAPGLDFPHAGEPGSGEDTLRLIAGLPAPEGLADRVKAGLRNAPQSGRILLWPGSLLPAGGWMYTSVARGAAAAAIVCIVAGGGWRIYSHVQQNPANLIVMPGGGFSGASATRLPDTLDGPVLIRPVTPPSEVNTVEKMPAPPTAAPHRKLKKRKPLARPLTSPVQ